MGFFGHGFKGFMMVHAGNDNAIGGVEFSTFGTGDRLWNNGETNRTFPVSFDMTCSRFTVRILTNSNTVDGCTIRLRKNLAQANQIIPVDQDTGIFTDITNTDSYVIDDLLDYRHTPGNGAIGFSGSSMICR